jgi:hypothetical protein
MTSRRLAESARRVAQGRNMRKQHGMTLIGMLIVAFIAGIFVLAGIRLIPVYLEYMSVNSAMDSMKRDLDGSNAGPGQIRTAISRRFDIDNVSSISARDIVIERTANGYVVRADYERRAPFLANVYFLVDFRKSVEVAR